MAEAGGERSFQWPQMFAACQMNRWRWSDNRVRHGEAQRVELLGHQNDYHRFDDRMRASLFSDVVSFVNHDATLGKIRRITRPGRYGPITISGICRIAPKEGG